MKNYDKNKESSYFQYLDANSLYGWAMSQTLSINGFEWDKDMSSINKKLQKFVKLIKIYDEEGDERHCLIQNVYMICIVIYHSYLKE